MNGVLIRWVAGLVLAGGCVCAAEPAADPGDASPPGGTLLRGTFAGEELVVQTEIGTIPVPTRVIERIDPHRDGRRIVLHLRNGDELPAIPEDPALPFATDEGVIEIPFQEDGGITLMRDKAGEVLLCRYPVPRPELLARDLVVHLTFDAQVDGRIPNNTKKTKSAVLVDGRLKDAAVSLDGHRDHLVLENHESFEQIDQFTVSLWVNIHNFGPGGYANEHGYLVNKGNDMWWNPAWCLGYTKGSGAGRGVQARPQPALFVVGTEKKGGRAKCRLRSRSALQPGQWYHLAGTYNGREAMLYVNGRLESRVAYDGRIRRDGAPLLLGGGCLQGTDFRNHFTTNATIDNLRIYRRAISPGEIRLLTGIEAREADPPG